MLVVYKFGFIFACKPSVDYKGNKKGLKYLYNFCEIYVKCNFMKARLTVEKVLSAICFLTAAAFFVAAILGVWRYFFTMGLSIAIGIMISDDPDAPKKIKSHKQ